MSVPVPVDMPKDVLDALERFIAARYPGFGRSEAVVHLLRRELAREGYLAAAPEHGTPPDQLDATNDD